MSVVRRFLIVSSLGRLIRKERGGSRITEGYFAPQGGRTSLVRIDGQQCHLVLIAPGQGGAASEERTEVPRAHGDALLDVCSGKAVYERTTLTLSPGRDAQIDRYVQPNGIDLVSLSFENDDAAKSFRAPIWFGTEVTSDNSYDRHSIALNGVAEPARLTLNSAMLDALLDVLEPRFGLGRFNSTSTTTSGASRTADSDVSARPSAANPPPSPTAISPASNTEPAAEGFIPASQPVEDRSSNDTSATLPTPMTGQSAGSAPSSAPKAPGSNQPAASRSQLPTSPSEEKADNSKPDARIDDVIESLSQALGAAIQQQPEGSRSDDMSGSFERWQVRPRRTQQ